MKDNRIIEEAALIYGMTAKEIEEFKEHAKIQTWMEWADYPEFYPLEDHNTIQGAICELDDIAADLYMYELEKVVCESPRRLMGGAESNALIVKASPRQKWEAFIKMLGRWEED